MYNACAIVPASSQVPLLLVVIDHSRVSIYGLHCPKKLFDSLALYQAIRTHVAKWFQSINESNLQHTSHLYILAISRGPLYR